MSGGLAIVLIWSVGLLIGTLIARWIANRPENHVEYTPDEMMEEMESAFVERKSLQLTSSLEYLPGLFDRIHATIDSGFPKHQIASLLHRIENQTSYYSRSAVYPVEVGGVASDLDLQWVRHDENRVLLLFTAVPSIIEALAHEAKEMPVKICT